MVDGWPVVKPTGNEVNAIVPLCAKVRGTQSANADTVYRMVPNVMLDRVKVSGSSDGTTLPDGTIVLL